MSETRPLTDQVGMIGTALLGPTRQRPGKRHRNEKLTPRRTKRHLCDTLERLSETEATDDAKREEILPVLYRHAIALAEERSYELPGAARDEVASALGERAASGLEKLDLSAPPAQQAAYLDRLLHHALADACRAVDPIGRGPRALRRRFEARLEDEAQATGAMPGPKAQDRILDEVVGTGRPTLRLLVGTGMSPDEAVAKVTRAGTTSHCDDPAETVVATMARRQIIKAIAAHPDEGVRRYLLQVAQGYSAKKPSGFSDRLGPALPALIWSLAGKRDLTGAGGPK